jgi:pentatricopeptide repeat protein
MSIRDWLAQRILDNSEGNAKGSDSFLARIVFGKEEPRQRALGEFDAKSYPPELVEQLRRRAEVTDAVLAMDFTTARARQDAILPLQQLLLRYPHPVVYEALIHAYVDSGRWDEARGIAFAARERRLEVERSTFPEIRSEIDRLKAWTPADVDAIRAERTAAVPAPEAAPEVQPMPGLA